LSSSINADREAALRAARAILSHRPPEPDDAAAREHLERFFALADLLPVPATPLNLNPGRPAATRHPARRRATVALPRIAVIVLLVALTFVTVLNFLPREDGFAPRDAIYLSGTGAARTARGAVLMDGGDLLVFASGLSDLESGYRYVVWLRLEDGYERAGSPVYLGDGRIRFAGTRPGASTSPIDQVEITIEEATNTGGPEGPVVLAGFGPLE
jgi:hypothetical protein